VTRSDAMHASSALLRTSPSICARPTCC
jgi:hypothetical protein